MFKTCSPNFPRAATCVRIQRIAIVAMLLILGTGCNLKANRHNMFGVRAFQTGQISQAINEFQKALTANPNNANAFYNLATSYSAMGKQSQNKQWLDQAETLYRQAISNDSMHADAHRGLAALLVESGREKFAFDLLQGWQQRQPGRTEPLVELARLYQEYGDNRRASDLLTDALKLNSNDKLALQALGFVRESQGQYQLALENYARALQVDPQQPEVASRIAALQARVASLSTTNPDLSNAVPPRYGTTSPYNAK